MVDDQNRTRSDEERLLDLDVDAAPESIGVYERPAQANLAGRNVVVLLAIFLLLVIAYFVLTAVL
jgi:hypothetical protein